MRKFLILFLISLLLIFSVKGLNGQGIENLNSNYSELYADSIIRTLGLEEKVSLLTGMGTSRSEFGDKGVPYFGIKGIPEKGIPDIIMGHGITGVRTGRDQHTRSTYFSTPIAIGCSWDIELYYEVGVAIAKEMRALGQDLNLGPTINIIRHPLGGRNWECFSEDPFLTSRFIVPYVKAMQSNGIICGPKHFVANNQEHNRFDINNVVDERTLREIYLPAFKAAVMEGGAMNIMASYNRLNGVYMCQNDYLLNQILRDEWGFKGFVLSDFSYGLRSTLAGAYSGLNVEMPGPKYYGDALVNAVKDGSISEAHIDRMLFDVIVSLHNIGFFDRPRVENEGIVHCENHIALAKKVADSSPVLLKNEDNLLPLKEKDIKSIAVLGPNASYFESIDRENENYPQYLQGGGSGRVYYFIESIISPLKGINDKIKSNIQIEYAQGCLTPDIYARKGVHINKSEDEKLITEAVKLAEKSEVAIVFAGLSGFNESEGWDRSSARLPGSQNRLIEEVAKVNKNTVVVLIAGSYVDVSSWIGKVETLLFVPYCGEQIGNGIADILLGDVTPSGKLPISWPRSESDFPNTIFKGKGFTEDGISNMYYEGLFVGYRWFNRENTDVLFPFGYGLSYTSFEYSDLIIDDSAYPVIVKVKVKNTGESEGAEIVQLYVSQPESTIEKALQELKAFKKVQLKPGEKKTISFTLNKEAFAHYNVDKKKWDIEKGNFIIKVGPDSANLKLYTTIKTQHMLHQN